MPVQTKHGTFAASTAASGTQAVTGVGFQPDVIHLFFINNTGTDFASATQDVEWGYGWGTSGSARWCAASSVLDGAGTEDANRSLNLTAVLEHVDASAAINGRFDITSMDSDGFTLDIEDQWDAGYIVHYFAIGGLKNVKVGTVQIAASAGTQAFTGVGFRPNALLIGGAGDDTGASANAKMFMGAGTSSSNRFVNAIQAQDAVGTTNTDQYLTNLNIAAEISTASATVMRADLESLDADGFTLDVEEIVNATDVGYVAFGGDDVVVTSITTAASGDLTAITGLGSRCVGGLVFGRKDNAGWNSLDTPQTQAYWSNGAFSATDARGTIHVFTQNNQATTSTSSGSATDAVHQRVDTAASETVLVDIKSLDSDGATFTMDDGDDGIRQNIIVMLFGVGTAGQPVRWFM